MRVSDQLTVALVSGGIALLVALLGIAGSIVAQSLATRQAFRNSLALFERQAADQDRARAAEALREDRHRFAEQRRGVYAKLLRVASDLVAARDVERTAAKDLARTQALKFRVGDESPPVRDEVEQRVDAHNTSRERKHQLDAQLEEMVSEVQLLAATPATAQAATALCDQARSALHVGAEEFVTTRDTFLHASRHELGIDAA